MSVPSPVVVKVGGSLYDLPDLGQRLRAWLDGLGAPEVLLVPGGGSMVDVVRDLDRRHGLGEEAAHWLALRAVSLNAWLLAAVIPRTTVIRDPRECAGSWRQDLTPILDGLHFARMDEGREGSLPHRWAVTSDALAARVARVMEARTLVLLKSTAVAAGTDWRDASQQGIVDEFFPTVVGRPGSSPLNVEVVNLRTWQPGPGC